MIAFMFKERKTANKLVDKGPTQYIWNEKKRTNLVTVENNLK